MDIIELFLWKNHIRHIIIQSKVSVGMLYGRGSLLVALSLPELKAV